MSEGQYRKLRSEMKATKALVMCACSVAADYLPIKAAFMVCAVCMMALSWREWPR